MKKTVCKDIVSCDRCGRVLDEVNTPFLRGYGSLDVKVVIFKADDTTTFSDGIIDKYDDLCVECARELQLLLEEFMKRKKKT